MKDERGNIIATFELISGEEMTPAEADDLAELIARFILDLVRQRAEDSMIKAAPRSDSGSSPPNPIGLDL